MPAETPHMVPEVPMVATAVLLLLHAPPAVALASVTQEPTQTSDGPVMAAGSEFTVTVVVAKQPVGIT